MRLVLACVVLCGCSFAIPSYVWHPTVDEGDTELSCPSRGWPVADAVIGGAGAIAGGVFVGAPNTSPVLIPLVQALGALLLASSVGYLGSSIYGFSRASTCNTELAKLKRAP